MFRVSKEIAIVVLLALPVSCSKYITPMPSPEPVVPTEEELANADFGPKPKAEELPALVRRYLKAAGYVDPNGAEIEECGNIRQGWTRVRDPKVMALDEWGEIVAGYSFLFAWTFECDVNGKNKMGGFTGFKRLNYFYKEGKVEAGVIPSTELPQRTGGVPPLLTPDSEPVLWQ